MKETKLAWIAGLMDGEGWIIVNVSKSHKNSLRISPRAGLGLSEGEWLDVMKDLADSLEINYYIRDRKGRVEFAVQGWKNTKPFLHSFKEYSVIKKPLIERILSSGPRSTRNRFISADDDKVVEEIKERAELVDFVREFNEGKNRPSKWTGKKILEFYGID